MKKSKLYIVAFIIAMFVAMTSCRRNSQLNNRPISGGPGIGIDTVTAEANTLPWPVTDIEHDFFYVSLPEGWKLIDKFDNGVSVLNGTIKEDFITGPYLTIEVINDDDTTPDSIIHEMVTGVNAIHGADVNILGYPYKVCTYIEDGYNHIMLVRKQDNRIIRYNIINSNTENPDIRSIFHQLELK